jgi:hypothetical protein
MIVSALVLLLLAVMSYSVWLACLDCGDRGGRKEVVGPAIMLTGLGLLVLLLLLRVLFAISDGHPSRCGDLERNSQALRGLVATFAVIGGFVAGYPGLAVGFSR